MKFATLLTGLLMLLFFGCSEEDIYPSAEIEAPACPVDSDLDYVGCWEDSECRYLAADNQWAKVRFYLTAEGEIFTFTWVYKGENCTGQKLYTDNKIDQPTLFEDIGQQINPNTGALVYLLSFNFKPTEYFKVLAELNPQRTQICFSNNLTVQKETRFYDEQGTEVDYSNCLSRVP